MTEYSRMAKGRFTSNGSGQRINLPFQPDFVEFLNVTVNATPRNNSVISGSWDFNDGQGTAQVSIYNNTGVYVTDSVAINGISTFSAGLMLQYGPAQQVVSIPKALFPTVTVNNHGYANGDVVVFEGLYQTPTTGMPQMSGIQFTVANVTTNTFTILWNTNLSNYTAISGSPVGATVKRVLYPFLYEPGVNFMQNVDLGLQTTINTTTPHNYVVGQEIAFRVPSVYGAQFLNSLPNNTIPGSPIYFYVSSVSSPFTFVCNFNSTGQNPLDFNRPVSSVPGLNFPQVLAVGDVNSGGTPYSGGALYPSPTVTNGFTTFSTINGPAINGAFINNTSQGFIIGSGTCVTDTSAVLVGNNGDVIRWRAFLHDISIV